MLEGLKVRMNKAAKRLKSLLLEPGDTLSQRVVRGGFWAFALRITNRLLQLIRTIVLALWNSKAIFHRAGPIRFRPDGMALLAMSTLRTLLRGLGDA